MIHVRNVATGKLIYVDNSGPQPVFRETNSTVTAGRYFPEDVPGLMKRLGPGYDTVPLGKYVAPPAKAENGGGA